MTDFKTSIIAAIEEAVPELAEKIQCGAVDAETTSPFATYCTPEEHPVRTKDGIAAIETLFEVVVFDSRVANAETLKRKVSAALEGLRIGNKVCRHSSSSSEYYPDYDLHSWTLTFKVI